MTVEKHYKYISQTEIREATKNFTTPEGAVIFNFNQDAGLMEQYGYKPLYKTQRPENSRRYKIQYEETDINIQEILIYLETEEEYEQRLYNERKADFDSKFLETSLGCYRLIPKGYANAQQCIDLVDKKVNNTGSLTEEIAVYITFYTKPDFSKEEECTEEWLIQNSYNISPMTLGEWSAYYDEFTLKYLQKMHQQELTQSN